MPSSGPYSIILTSSCCFRVPFGASRRYSPSAPGEIAGVDAGQVRNAHQIFVDGPGGFAPFVNGPHHQRLAAAQVAGGEHAVAGWSCSCASAFTLPRGSISKFKSEIGPRFSGPTKPIASSTNWQGQTSCVPSTSLKTVAALLVFGPFDPHGHQAFDVAICVAAEFLRQNAPLAAAAFFVRGAGAQNHRPQRPRRAGRTLIGARIIADIGRLRQQFELRQAAAALAVGGAVAVAAGIAAADDNHVFPGGQNLIFDIESP